MLIELLPGIDSGFSSELREAFYDTNTTHIIAISGLKKMISTTITTEPNPSTRVAGAALLGIQLA